jgi:hypothetical protein
LAGPSTTSCRSIFLSFNWAVDVFLSFNLPAGIVQLKNNDSIGIDLRMGDGAIKAVTIGMQIGAFELKFNAGILKQEVLAQSKIKCKQDSSQRTEDLRSKLG